MILNVLKSPDWETLNMTTGIGRTAYWEGHFDSLLKSNNDDAEHFLKKLIEQEHESVLEHLFFIFNIRDISRWATHQLVRHRIGSFTQKSLRKKRELTVNDFVINPNIPDLEKAKAREFFCMCVEEYDAALEAELAPDDARMYLPGCIKSEITWTINLRALRNFIKLRSKKDASWEMILLSRMIYGKFIELGYPFLLEDVMANDE